MEEYLRGGGAVVAPPAVAPAAPVPPIASSAPSPMPATVPAVRIDRLTAALGGPDNIREVAAVAKTRLRVVLFDDSRVDTAALGAAGARGVMKARDGVVHVLVGLGAETLLDSFKRAAGQRA
jgi:phosphotransferase system IIB component